jgi:hypothetical protein
VNNREKATLIWLAIALAAALTQAEIRESLWACVKAFASIKIVGPLLALAGWTIGLVVIAHSVGLWEADVRNDTVYWFLTIGLAFVFSLKKVTEGGFFRKTTRRALALTAFVEGFSNLAVFGLALELVLLPFVTFLAVLLVVSESKEEYAPVRRLLNGLLTIVGVCVLVYVAVRVAGDFDASHTLRALALPVWLTIGSVPFVYVFAVLVGYEQAFMRIDLHTDDPTHSRRAKRALLRAANLRAAEVGGFTRHWISDLASAESTADARAVMRRWRKTWRTELHAERIEDARAYMEEWLTQDEPALAEIHADALRRSWDRLDHEQRATLKAERLRVAPRTVADDLRALPD